ncbi:aspartyl-tRNA(Asn)/glutamyl-tRNA(Gln) amidotransferase subunit A [Prauserella sediminis]|uniref:Aspartyl-tRNA(Asn)/glutamyl-tRNA(Gln) amidotransferase subunit A n=1 Tax=Prauserella sediminis TaxID=577680 RepID=A0A839XMK2_9PSEU|nr:amidase [Prauserella sediminis]MBB3664500.1 aspartyl-tRNA(Asn)/glutamyl-tRNA(Gln) amidotransferase subunit A [Prauserella sediminis]
MSDPVNTDLHYLTATDALALFRSRELSPVELLDAVIERAAKTEPVINAHCEELFDEAREAARASEARYLGRGEPPRALEGIPVATKEKHAIAGRPSTDAAVPFADRMATESAAVVERVQAAGGIIHARTTTPEFCIAFSTYTPLYGVTRNPWQLDCTPGGSSGGAGASLAAGSTILATGSDIGGSTRVPASFNGVVGFKAPYGRVPGTPPNNLDYYRGDGPMARTIEDTVLFQNVLAGPDFRDHSSVVPKLTLPTELGDVAGMRIALSITLGDYPVEASVRENTMAVAEALRAGGATVEEVALPWKYEEITRTWITHISHTLGPNLRHVADQHGDQLADYTLAMAEQTRRHSATPFGEAMQAETTLQRELAETMEGFDALICPTMGLTEYPADRTVFEPLLVDGHPVEPHFSAFLTHPFNLANRCPVLAVPSGHAPNGVPTGVQIVGHPYQDEAVFRVGKALQIGRPWAFTTDHQPKL